MGKVRLPRIVIYIDHAPPRVFGACRFLDIVPPPRHRVTETYEKLRGGQVATRCMRRHTSPCVNCRLDESESTIEDQDKLSCTTFGPCSRPFYCQVADAACVLFRTPDIASAFGTDDGCTVLKFTGGLLAQPFPTNAYPNTSRIPRPCSAE